MILNMVVSPIFIVIFMLNTSAASSYINKDEATVVSTFLSKLNHRRVTIAYPSDSRVPSKWTINVSRIFSLHGIAVNYFPVDDLYAKFTSIKYYFFNETTAILTRSSHFVKCFDNEKYVNKPIRFRNLDEQYKWKIRNQYKWVVLMDSYQFLNISIPYHVEVFLIYSSNYLINYKKFLILEQYDLKTIQQKTLATWTNDTGLQMKNDKYIFYRRTMNGSYIFFLSGTKDFGYFDLQKISTEIIDSLSTVFDLKLIKTFYIDKADVTASFILYHRVTPFKDKFIGPVLSFKVNLYFQKLSENSLENYILQPFQKELWWVVIGWMATAAVTSVIISIFYKRKLIDSIFKALSVYDAFCGQDTDEEHITLADRIKTLSIWTTVLVVTSSYSSEIFSFMTIRQPYVPFNNVKGFIKDGTYMFGGVSYSMFQSNIDKVENGDSSIVEAYSRYFIGEKDLPNTTMDGIIKMCKDKKFAFLGFGNTILREKAPCRLQQMPQPFFKGMYSIGTRHGFDLSQAFKERLPLMRSNGIFSKLQKNYDQYPNDESNNIFLAVDTQLTRAVLLVVPVGVLLSLFVLALEILLRKRHQLLFLIRIYFRKIYQ